LGITTHTGINSAAGKAVLALEEAAAVPDRREALELALLKESDHLWN